MNNSLSFLAAGEVHMDPKKLQFAEDVERSIRKLCKLTFNITTNEEMESVFNIPNDQLKGIIKKIAEQMPHYIFDQAYKKKLEEIKTICAREFIFFQVQEKMGDPQYELDLSNFIRIFCRDIQRNF